MYDFWSLCLLFFFIYNVIADIDTSKPDDMDDFNDNRAEGYKSHSDIKAKWRFLNRNSLPIEQAPFASPKLSPTKDFYKVPLRESTSILLSLRNLGESTFNITSLTGYIHAAHRFSFYVQNSTVRRLNSVLLPNSEISVEYRFIPWSKLPSVDYVFSCDIAYKLVINQETESKRLPIEYKYKFMNVTINIYDTVSIMSWIDYKLFFMAISIVGFWAFVGVLFHELWWIPNQEAQGKQPLSTQDLLIFYANYAKSSYYIMTEKLFNKPNPMANNASLGRNGGKNTTSNGGSRSPKKSRNDSWLSGTSAAKKRKKKN